jgi:multicomponent Na+:H+ antiporter subunit D
VVGALAIAAFPLTSGYVAKSVIVDAIAADGNAVAWFVVTAGAAGVVLHAGLRLPWSVFFGDGDARVASRDPPLSMKLAMALLAVVTLGLGLFPSVFFGLLPGAVDVAPYGASHVVGQVQLLAFAGLGFVLLRRWRVPSRGIALDVDWLWRYAGPRLYRAWRRHAVRGGAALAQRRLRGVERFVRGLYRHHGPQGVLARSWPTGSMAIWAVFMLGAYLVIYYF